VLARAQHRDSPTLAGDVERRTATVVGQDVRVRSDRYGLYLNQLV
jgi:hypothetical protein